MNLKLIVFSAVVTATLGAAIGFIAAHLFPTPYMSEFYRNLDRKYAIVGGVGGLLVGATQEMIRESQAEREEREEAEKLRRAAFFDPNDRN